MTPYELAIKETDAQLECATFQPLPIKSSIDAERACAAAEIERLKQDAIDYDDRVREMRLGYESERGCTEMMIQMAIDSMGGLVEGAEPHRGNWLQRVRELVEKESRISALESQLAAEGEVERRMRKALETLWADAHITAISVEGVAAVSEKGPVHVQGMPLTDSCERLHGLIESCDIARKFLDDSAASPASAIASARAEVVYFMKIYEHAHTNGNSVPPNIVADCRAALRKLEELEKRT